MTFAINKIIAFHNVTVISRIYWDVNHDIGVQRVINFKFYVVYSNIHLLVIPVFLALDKSNVFKIFLEEIIFKC